MSKKKIRISSKQKGNSLEDILRELVEFALREWGFEPIEIRIQKSGSQFGKDSISRWVEVKGEEQIVYEWCIEAKNYGSTEQAAQIDSDSIGNKAHQTYMSDVPLDCWCIFSPFGYVDNTFRENMDKARLSKKYPFRIVLWDSDDKIERLIACFPDIYKKLYNKEPKITSEERIRILVVWKQQIIEKTKEGKGLREKFSTQGQPREKAPDSSTGQAAQELEQKTAELSIYKPTQVQFTVEKNITSGVEKASIQEELAEAKELLDKGKTDDAKVRYFKILGKIEDKSGLEEELSKVYNNLGVISHVENDINAAIDYFKKAAKLNSGFIMAVKNLASVHIANASQLPEEEAKKELAKAETILQPLLSNDSIDPMVLQVQMKLVKAKGGIESVNKFVEENKEKYEQLFENDESITLTLGHFYLEAHQLEKALHYANRAVEVHREPESLMLRGRILLATALEKDAMPHSQAYGDLAPEFIKDSNLKKAKTDFDDAFKLAQENEQVLFYKEAVYFKSVVRSWLKEPQEDITLPKQPGLPENTGFGDKFTQAVVAFRNKDFQTSFSLLKQLPEFAHFPYEEVLRIARAYLYRGQPEIAIEIYSRIEEEAVRRKDPNYWLDMSMIYVLLNDKNNAFIAAKKARDIAEGPIRKTVLSHYGAVMLRYAKEEGGDRLLENALQFEKEYPELAPLERIDAIKEKDKIIKMFQDRQRWVQNIKQIFRNNPLPSYMLQKTFKQPFVVVWSGRDPEMPINFTSSDFNPEFEKNYDDAKVLVFDYLALLTLSKLNLLNDLEKLPHKIQVSFNLFQKVQEELLQEENESLRRLWDFLRNNKNIELVKEVPTKKLKGQKMNEIFEEWLVDTVKLGKNKDAIVVTDDLRISLFLRSENVKSANSWIILQKVTGMGLLDQTMYSKAIGKLAECFYTFISFNGQDLFTVVAEDNYKLTARSYFLIEQIHFPGSDLKSFSLVFKQFINEMWRPGLVIDDKIFWLDYISNIFGSITEKLPLVANIADPDIKKVLDTADEFSDIWGIAIAKSSKEELLVLKKKLPDMIKQPIFAKVKEHIKEFIEKRLKDLEGENDK